MLLTALATCRLQAQVDPCLMVEGYTGGTAFGVPNNGTNYKDIGNGFHAEVGKYGGSCSMTYFGGDADCAYKASWSGTDDFFTGIGYYDPSSSKKDTDLGNIKAYFNYVKSGSGGSYSYIGIHGWTTSPLLEYFILDDSFSFSAGGAPGAGYTEIGTYVLDGATYTLYQCLRQNMPSILGVANFTQIFAVRNTFRNCGEISVSEHFKKWKDLSITLGSLYECKIYCEVSGGSGAIEYKYASMSWGKESGTQTPEMSISREAMILSKGDVVAGPTLTLTDGLTATYSSSNSNVVSVDKTTGQLTAKEVGAVTITAATDGNDNYAAASTTYQVMVVNDARKIRCDANSDGVVNVADVVEVVDAVMDK